MTNASTSAGTQQIQARRQAAGVVAQYIHELSERHREDALRAADQDEPRQPE